MGSPEGIFMHETITSGELLVASYLDLARQFRSAEELKALADEQTKTLDGLLIGPTTSRLQYESVDEVVASGMYDEIARRGLAAHIATRQSSQSQQAAKENVYDLYRLIDEKYIGRRAIVRALSPHSTPIEILKWNDRERCHMTSGRTDVAEGTIDLHFAHESVWYYKFDLNPIKGKLFSRQRGVAYYSVQVADKLNIEPRVEVTILD